MFPPVDTKDARAVAAFVEGRFAAMYPDASLQWLRQLFTDMQRFFSGKNPNYQKIDVRYHDFEHTLQATLCIAQIFEGRDQANAEPRLTPRQFELAVSAALLHDSGYLKLKGDTAGTGAKYTYCHVLRSCAFAASYLPTLGASDYEVEAVLGAINCTGPNKNISRLFFREPVERIVGCALATADYLGQMAALDYPDELEILFNEFKESDDFIHLPASRRTFKSAADLVEKTPLFWKKFVQPKLETDFMAIYRFLAKPYPHGPNAYLDAVERNMVKIKRHAAKLKKSAA